MNLYTQICRLATLAVDSKLSIKSQIFFKAKTQNYRGTVMSVSSCVSLCIILTTLSSVVSEDFYNLLGVSKNADNRDIRKAFKKLALKYHPDKNNEDDAHEKFLKLNRAYEILKDDETRKKYDLFGEDGLDGSTSNSRPKVL